MLVNQLAARAKVSPHTVRYYTRLGLLRPRKDGSNGYQRYPAGDVQRLQFIQQAKHLGFTLTEIETILGDAVEGQSPCPRVREIVRRRIEENRRKLAELAALQGRMEQALAQWEAMPDGVPDGDCVCHLIESIPQ